MLRNRKLVWTQGWEAANAASRRWLHAARGLTGILSLWLWIILASGVTAQEANPNRAALVVVHGDGRTVTRCVEFAEAQITGLELVQRSGLDLNLEASSMGATICRLDGEGCAYPQQSCFCQCEGENCVYWSYWRSQAGGWVYSNLGAASSVVAPGALEGWVWGAGTVDAAQSPPAITFGAICAAPTATSTATSTATPTFTATANAEAIPTATWTPSPTASATPAPTATAPPFASVVAPPTATATWTTVPAPTPSFTPPPLLPGATLSPPVITTFAADRREIIAGETVIVRWQVTNAETVTLQAAGKTVTIPAVGELMLAPPQNTTYLLAAANMGGAVSTAMTIIVRPQPSPPADTLPPAIAPSPASAAVIMSAAVTISMPLTPSPTPITALTTPTATPTAAPPATLATTPTAAPVALDAAPRGDTASVAATPPTQPAPVAPLLLMIVGGVAILGVPLVGLALFLLFVTLRRM